MNEWTLGAVLAHGMQLEAHCKNEVCRRFFTFILPGLIESVGPDNLVSDIPPMDCEACGGPLSIVLAMGHQEGGGDV